MNAFPQTNSIRNTLRWKQLVRVTPVLLLALMFTACSTNLQSKVAGNLNQLSKQQTVAILPVEVMETGQKEAAAMFRQGLYANLKESKFNLLERYVVDGLLKQNNLTDPAQFLNINPMRFAEILGADAVLISRINKIERSYLVIHSSIEIGVSIQMVDTRTGEILWRAEQTESDFQGIGKIPTGISSIILGPIQFVTNKLNLHRMTSKLVNKLTAVVKKPEDAEKSETFEKPLIASAATRDLKKIEDIHNLEAEWAEDVAVYTEVPVNLNDPKENFASDSPENIQTELAHLTAQSPASESEEMQPTNLRWTPRKENSIPVTAKSTKTIFAQPDKVTVAPVSIAPVEKIIQTTQYTIQIGAYKTKTNASKVVNQLSEKGYNAFITQYSKDGATLFKVHVEKFSDKEKAYQLANRLSNKENLPNFVTTINPG